MNALDTLVYLSPRNEISGVHAPGVITSKCKREKCVGPHTSDWRAEPGSLLNHHKILPQLTRTTLNQALYTFHPTEVHIAAYAVLDRDGVPLERQPRVCKDAIPWLRSQGFEIVLTAYQGDWDTPGHVPWTPELLEQFHSLWSFGNGPLATCGVYLSPKGARLIQPLTRWVPIEEGEGGLRVWLAQLADAGVDRSILQVKDWTRLMRAPHHRKLTGAVVRSAFIDFKDCEAIDPIAAPPAPARPLRAKAPRSVSPTTPTKPTAALDAAHLERLALRVGTAIRETVFSDWRRCYMALAGALCTQGIALADIPNVITRVYSIADSGGDKSIDRENIALSTVSRFQSGLEVTGFGVLSAEFPAVAEALELSAPSPAEQRVLAQLATPAPPIVSIDEAVSRIQNTIARARGLVGIVAPPGTGKTYAVTQHALTLPPIGERAAPGARIAVSAPTHKLAKQTASKIKRSLHLFSPPSHTNTEGQPTCIYAEAARSLAAGGQSVAREFCKGRKKNPCERSGSCDAEPGWEGDENANLVTGVHGLTNSLLAYAGISGTLVVDEPGEPLLTEAISLDDLNTAARFLDVFEERYVAAVRPALLAITAWIAEIGDATSEGLTPLPAAIAAGAANVDDEALANAGIDPLAPPDDLGNAIIQSLLTAIDEDSTSKAPPIRWTELVRARVNPARAAELSRASRVLNLLRLGLESNPVFAVRIDERGDERCALLTGPNRDLLAALQHTGAVVLLDANLKLHLPAIEKLIGSVPPVVELNVRDGAPITRTILVNARATRTRWMPRGVPDWEAIVPSLRAALLWLGEDSSTQRVAILCPKELATALSFTRSPESKETKLLIEQSRVSKRVLTTAAQFLGPILAMWHGEMMFGHYGGLEGLDHLSGCDATITLGDPRPNLGQEIDKALYLGLDVEGRLDALAAAELQQAHGRLRTIHRRTPGRQLHVGAVVPSGWQGLPVDVRRLPAGRPKALDASMSGEQLKQIREAMGESARSFAKALGVSSSTITRYESGERAVPAAVVHAVLALAGPKCSRNPSLNNILAGGFGNAEHPFKRSTGFGSTPCSMGFGSTGAANNALWVSGALGDMKDTCEPSDAELAEVASW